ncbi:flavin-binding monooxygenase-like protein [Hirsutella rhossiliensis]|uniref:Flavin-binding monooxygenase-like protein n=1 Tax=Hirsutella rhossiliensis TaxID=111463 RepID=A0A9P8SLS1_9HYPO|nr:flavin-binding monooxygenase-like protein [Hirsutella rhossiliensis]KAH0966080.1 flavin-binding monooxygenase-like protein [Hirsutella rhossiliensis]
MEHPVREIGAVITTLTTGSPAEQQAILHNVFLSDASFSHPFCRVPSFPKGTIPLLPNADSRSVLLQIYRWYRTLSPNIDITIDSAVFDQRTGQLFVSIRQTFAIWFVPFYKAPVRLVTVLQLRQRPSQDSPSPEARESAALAGPGQERTRYFIASQEDLYTFNDCAQFLLPGLGPFLWNLWQLLSTALCVVGSLVFLPLYLLMNKDATAKKIQ